jgi:hypothetical protein
MGGYHGTLNATLVSIAVVRVKFLSAAAGPHKPNIRMKLNSITLHE